MRWLLTLLVVLKLAGPIHAGEISRADTVTSLIADNNQFALRFYGQLRARPGNLFFSPNSISAAFAMTYAGARGTTAEEMARVLQFRLPRDELPGAFAAIRAILNGNGANRPYQLSVANRLWGQEGYHFLPDFLTVTRDAYGAELAQVDFARQTELARQVINTWVTEQTRGKIADLIPSGVLETRTRLVLTNAIYFKGNWSQPFPKFATKDAPFHLTSKDNLIVPLMSKQDHLRYGAADGLKVLELPYTKGELAMVVLLPDEIDGLPALENRLTMKNLDHWLAEAHNQKVQIFLPRFKMTAQVALDAVLKAMGMSLAFNESKADLSGISSQEQLYIAAALHKALVDVNEEGTEAAAATAVVAAPRAIRIEPEPAVFRADHPFVFLIRDNRTGSILFIGRLMNPKQ